MRKYNVNRPLYQELRNTLAQAIYTGVYPHGTQLPGVDELSKSYQVSKCTVTKALKLLEQEGILRCSQGRRTRVNTTPAAPRKHHKIAILLNSPTPDGSHLFTDGPWSWTIHQALLMKLLRDHNPAFTLSYRYDWIEQLEHVDGVIALEAYGKWFDAPSRLDRLNIPYIRVQVASHLPILPESNTIYLDWYSAAQQAAIYFLANGVEKIVMQNLEFGDRPLTNPNHRLFGFYQLLKQEGFPEQNIILQNSFYKDNFMPSSEQFDFMHGIIRGSSSPKYGFIYNDQTARMLVNLAIKYNRKLKKDLIILALGGLPTPGCGITPVMSSINAPLAKLSESALDMLYDLIDRKQNNCPNRQLHLNLQIHDT